MNQAAAAIFQFPASHNPSQNNIPQNVSPNPSLHAQDRCGNQPQVLNQFSSVSRPLLPTSGTSLTTTEQPQMFTTTLPLPSAMSNAEILPSLPSNGNVKRQFQSFAHTKEVTTNETVVETKERRQRRLARNRESARQSRRRKKQLLSDLGLLVNKLQTQIETERQNQLVVMEKKLAQDRNRLIQELFHCDKYTDADGVTEGVLRDRIKRLIQCGGPNSTARRNAAAFQYDSLSQLILPRHKRYLLWLSLREESFFTTAKEKRSKTGKGTGRVSSKHVGDELSAAHRCAVRINAGVNSKTSIACPADDAHRSWPLICYELGVSLDQEEKLLNSFQRVKCDPEVKSSRTKMSIATTVSSNLKNGVLYQSHSASERNEAALLRVLTPSQTSRFQQWIMANQSRCQKILGANSIEIKTTSNCSPRDKSVNDLSLSDVCKQLTEALKISRKGEESNFA